MPMQVEARSEQAIFDTLVMAWMADPGKPLELTGEWLVGHVDITFAASYVPTQEIPIMVPEEDVHVMYDNLGEQRRMLHNSMDNWRNGKKNKGT